MRRWLALFAVLLVAAQALTAPAMAAYPPSYPPTLPIPTPVKDALRSRGVTISTKAPIITTATITRKADFKKITALPKIKRGAYIAPKFSGLPPKAVTTAFLTIKSEVITLGRIAASPTGELQLPALRFSRAGFYTITVRSGPKTFGFSLVVR